MLWGARIGGITIGDDVTYAIRLVPPGIDGHLEKPDTIKGHRKRPREDGRYMGRTWLDGRTITLTGAINRSTAVDARASWRELSAVWSAPEVRGVPGAAVPLELTVAGGPPLVVWGQPDKLAPAEDPNATIEAGTFPFVATFDCVDHRFYGPEQSVRVPLVAAAASGMTWPTRWPLRWTARSSSERRAGEVEIGGTVGSWLQATVHAPGGMTRPVIAVEDVLEIELDYTLRPGSFVTVIASPWARSVLLDGRTDIAWALTPRSGLLKHAVIPPGPRQVSLRGTDPSGTAELAFSWRDAHESI